jgi:hypothetical protein
MPQQSYHHQQYDKIHISNSFKGPTKQGLNASEKLQHVPKERSQRKKLGHKIINVTYPDNTLCGLAFDNFYDAKDVVKHLSNRDGKVTIFGGIEFKPFSNLTTKWVKSLMLGNLLWIIRIDTTKNGMEDSFPMQAHLALANKIAWAIIRQNIWQEGGIDVVGVSLNESQVADLTLHFIQILLTNQGRQSFKKPLKRPKKRWKVWSNFTQGTVMTPSGATPDSIWFDTY